MSSPSTRPLRADAQRNRDHLLAIARAAFAADGDEVTLDRIARDAGVGIGTLYRHFPTRESLVDAVYRDQVARLTSSADQLLAELPPAVALRRWMDLFGEWIATKSGMIDTLLAMIESGAIAHHQTQSELTAAVDALIAAGTAAGELRAGITAEDIAASLIGIYTVAPLPEHRDRARRLLDIVMDGLRPRPD